MKAFFAHDQLLHQPTACGPGHSRVTNADATRVHAALAALDAQGIALDTPADYGVAIEAVHASHYLGFLRHAHERWQLHPDQATLGTDVYPALSPPRNAWQRAPLRGACQAQSVIGQAGYYLGDRSCKMGPDTWRAALRSSHCAIAAADWVATFNDVAYAVCGPPGNHAHYDRAASHCFLNNSAMAAQRLRSTFQRVAILDIDAHHGDGTQDIFYDRADIMTLSIHNDPGHAYPYYTGYACERGLGLGHGYNINMPLGHGAVKADFLIAMEKALATMRDFRADALVLALGTPQCTPHPAPHPASSLEVYQRVGERVGTLHLPTVIVQEGGCQAGTLQSTVDAFLQGLSEATI